MKITAKILRSDEKYIYTIPKTDLVHKYEDKFVIDLIFNEIGNYEIQLFVGDESSTQTHWMTSHRAIVNKNPEKKCYYPQLFSSCFGSNFSLLEPQFSAQVMKGTLMNFRIQCGDQRIKDKLYINTFGNYVKMKLEKDTKDIYFAKDMYIVNNQVIIGNEKNEDGNYNILVKYNSVDNPDKKEVSYPQTYLAPENELIEPLMEKLKANEKYTFKLRSSEIAKMAIINNDKWTMIEKGQGDLFEVKDLQVEKGQLKFSFEKPGTNSYGTAYSYIVE